MGYQASLTYLYGLQKYGIKFGLSTVSKLLTALGNPQQKFPCIHIAGTNGKGSTAAFLASILSEAGYKTGLYTSPHLTSFTERIRINGADISRKSVIRLTGIIRECAAQLESITFFEFVTAMAFSYFAEQKVECAVIEAGMGGRLDATNVIIPLVSIITNISREHEMFLGNTVLKIAQEKAGIIKRNKVLLTAVRHPTVLRLFARECRRLHAVMLVEGKDFALQRRKNHSLAYRGMGRDMLNLRLGLRGEHQLHNAALALAAADVLCQNGFTLRGECVRRGLKHVHWPGRLETAKGKSLILLDGAHNPAAIRCLKQALLSSFAYDRLTLVLGIMNDKDIRTMLKEIVSIADRVICCRPRMERAAPTARLAHILCGTKIHCVEIPGVGDALLQAMADSGRHDLICVTGSLFTVGEAKEALRRLPHVADIRVPAHKMRT